MMIGKIVSVRNLFEDEDYAKQFEETAKRFGKGDKFNERKYYHFKLSCARSDNVTAQQAHRYAEEVAEKLFETGFAKALGMSGTITIEPTHTSEMERDSQSGTGVRALRRKRRYRRGPSGFHDRVCGRQRLSLVGVVERQEEAHAAPAAFAVVRLGGGVQRNGRMVQVFRADIHRKAVQRVGDFADFQDIRFFLLLTERLGEGVEIAQEKRVDFVRFRTGKPEIGLEVAVNVLFHRERSSGKEREWS